MCPGYLPQVLGNSAADDWEKDLLFCRELSVGRRREGAGKASVCGTSDVDSGLLTRAPREPRRPPW